MNNYIAQIQSYLERISFREKTKYHIIALLIIPAFLYIRILTFNVIGFDDNGIIENAVKWLDNVKTGEHVLENVSKLGNFGDSFYRPVQFVSYEVDASFSQKDPWMYHVSNLIVHLLTVITLYFFLQHFTIKKTYALVSSIMYAVHPLAAVAVAWIPSRGDTLIALFGMLLFISYDNYFKKGKKRYFVLHSLLFLVIMFTKESTVFFPVFLVTYSHYIVNIRFRIKKYAPFIIVWTSVVVLYFLLRHILFHNGMPADAFTIGNFLHNLPSLPGLLGKILVPYKLSTLPLFDFETTLVGGICAIPLIFIIIHGIRHKQYIYLWCFAWFIAFNLAPMFYKLGTADFFYNYLEHRNYLPMIGIFIMLTIFISKLTSEKLRRFVQYAIIPVIVVFSILSFIQCGFYKNGDDFNDRAYYCNQNNITALNGIGSKFFGKGQFDVALNIFNRSLGIRKTAMGYFYRGCIYEVLGKSDLALADYSMIMQYLNTIPSADVLVDALTNKANQKAARNDFEGAINDLTLASQIDSTKQDVFYNLGIFLFNLKQYQNAIGNFDRAINLKSTMVDAYINRAYCKFELHDYEGAIADNATAIKMNPVSTLAYNNTGVALRELQRYDEAISSFNRTINLDSKFAAAYYGRATVLLLQHDVINAKKDFYEAARLGYKAAENYLIKLNGTYHEKE